MLTSPEERVLAVVFTTGLPRGRMRSSPLIGAALVAALLLQTSPPAQAGLIGNGANTVSALFFLGAPSTPMPPYTNPAPSEVEDYVNAAGMTTNTPPPTIAAHFVEGALDLSTIDVGDTQITITNLAPPAMPFCSVATTPCPDVFTGFAFTFSGGVNITGVSVDPASATDFRPNSTAPHDGLQLLSPTDISVDITGDAPASGDELILDVSVGGAVTALPEPASAALLAIGLVGVWSFRPRPRHRPAGSARFS